MRFVTGEEIDGALTFDTLIAALEAGHRKPPTPVDETIIGDASAKFFIRSTGAPGQAFGSKLITVVPGNEERSGLPSIQAVFVLFDGTTGAPRGMLDGTALTYWKTSADSGLGAKLLARSDAKTLLMVGAGRMAPWLIRAHLSVRPSIETILVWNRSPAGAAKLVDELLKDGIAADVVTDLAAAAGSADIISTATMAKEPVIRGAWLSAGTHLDLVGGWTPEMREADDDAVTKARIFVDSRESAFAGVGDILTPVTNGVIEKTDILGDLYDLASGTDGRRSADDVTLFKNAGGAHLDLMTAEAVLAALDTGAAS